MKDIILITGGTSSFGNAMLRRYMESDVAEIRIFSRDEKKQDDMRRQYASPKLRFYLGDVRNLDSLEQAMAGVTMLFHAAALKQVPSCEFHPMEAVRTNILGADNVLQSAYNNHVKRVVVLSTDKAAYPINAMGMSKAMMEKGLYGRICGLKWRFPAAGRRVRYAWRPAATRAVARKPSPPLACLLPESLTAFGSNR